jgi:hypothetical protein
MPQTLHHPLLLSILQLSDRPLYGFVRQFVARRGRHNHLRVGQTVADGQEGIGDILDFLGEVEQDICVNGDERVPVGESAAAGSPP